MTSKNGSRNQRTIKVADEDWNRIKERAHARGMSVSSFLLAAARVYSNQKVIDGTLGNSEMRRIHEAVMDMVKLLRRLEKPLVVVTEDMNLDGVDGSLDLRGTVRALYLMEADKRKWRSRR